MKVMIPRIFASFLMLFATTAFVGCDNDREVLDVETPDGELEIEEDMDTGEMEVETDE